MYFVSEKCPSQLDVAFSGALFLQKLYHFAKRMNKIHGCMYSYLKNNSKEEM